MKRVTQKDAAGHYYMTGDGIFLVRSVRDRFMGEDVDAVGAIEDILGDDYDLDRLRELVEISKEIPHTCCFCIGCEIEPNDGHGCDGYDNFVFSPRRLRELVKADREGRCTILSTPERLMVYENLECDIDPDRLRELVEADREGRCIVAPVKPGEIAWCGFKQYDPIMGTVKNIIYPVVLRGWWTGLECAEYDPRHFEFHELYPCKEAAEAALKGENNGR